MTLMTPVTPSTAPMTPSVARTPRLGRRPWRSRLLPVLGLGAGLSCTGEHLEHTPPRDPAVLYWELTLNHHAVTLSLLHPYDTLTLVATPRNAQGEPLADLGTPQYSSPDFDRVQVTPEGVLHAVGLTAAGQPLAVVATLTAGNLRHVDTVLVRVVADTLPKLARLSIHPIPPDSAKLGAISVSGGGGFDFRRLPIQAVDSNGTPINDLLVAVRSSDILTAWVSNIQGSPIVRGQRLGGATLVASATVFGVAKADTVPYRVGWPIYATITVQRQVPVGGDDEGNEFSPQEVRVGAGAVVLWRGTSGDTIDVTFADDDTANVVAADPATAYFVEFAKVSPVPNFDGRHFICNIQYVGDCDGRGSFVLSPETYPSAYRVFPVPGTYEYHGTRTGAMGRVVVMDEG